jgi:hypothetical protein
VKKREARAQDKQLTEMIEADARMQLFTSLMWKDKGEGEGAK